MTAERKIVVTAISREDPFIIWRTKYDDIEKIKETVTSRRPGEDVFIKDAEGDLEVTVVDGVYDQVVGMLAEGWKLDPFFHTTGRPWTVDNGHVWVLVWGTPEEVAELNPYVELPEPEVTEADQATMDKFHGIVDIVDLKPEDKEDGRVTELTSRGYEVFNILKGSVILVKRREDEPTVSLEAELELKADEKYRQNHGLDDSPEEVSG